MNLRLAAAAALTAAAALAGCGQAAHAPRPAATVTATAAAPSPSASLPPDIQRLVNREAVLACAASLEIGAGNGHDYSGLPPHDQRLPYTCQKLDLAHLTKAAGLALRDMQSQG